MNKFLKLPLFLAVVGGICTAVLATTYALTNPIVVQRVQKEQFAAYFGAFDLLEADGETPKLGASATDEEVSADLLAVGISKKVSISYNNELLGYAYDGLVKGRNGDIKFQVSFKDGKYNSYAVLGGHSENAGFEGADLVDNLATILPGKPADTYTTAAAMHSDLLTGATAQSTTNLLPAIVAAANDYMASI